jgi:small-conductance mechanosensitive channel
MRAIWIWFFVFTFFVSGAPLDKNIVDGNMTTYSKLLEKLSKDSNLTEDMMLQKSLLEELNSTETTTQDQDSILQKVKDANDYKTLFLDYIEKLNAVSGLQKRLDDTNNKIKAVEAEIDSMDAKNPGVLTNELQDALYHKTLVHFRKRLKTTQQQIAQIQNRLEISLKNIRLDSETVAKDITADTKDLLGYRHKITRTNIALEQEEMINNKNRISYLESSLAQLQKIYRSLATNLAADRFLLFSAKLQAEDQTVFKLQKKIIHDIESYKILSSTMVDDYFAPFLLDMENSFMGKLTTAAGASRQEIKDVIHSSWQMMNNPLFYINKTPISAVSILIALLIFAVGFLVSSVYKKYIRKISFKSKTLTDSTSTLLSNLGSYTLFLITFFIVLKFLGIDLSSIALVAGALSVGIGFGLQNIISNFVSGIILMVERSIRIGDYIELDNNLRGRVIDIKMRSVTINTNENIDIIVPNQKLIENNVINWTMNDTIRRFSIPFGVAYGTDAHKVIDLITKAVLESPYKDDIINTSRYKTTVIMTGMGDSSVDFELFVWVKGDQSKKPKRTSSEFLLVIYDTLNANGIEIPFPQQDIHIKSIKEDIPVKLKDANA